MTDRSISSAYIGNYYFLHKGFMREGQLLEKSEIEKM
jgi:hypothetical protein